MCKDKLQEDQRREEEVEKLSNASIMTRSQILLLLLTVFHAITTGEAFTSHSIPRSSWSVHNVPTNSRRSTTSLPMVWWFGGNNDEFEDDELVGVRIERLTPNSRRIGGEIVIDSPLEDVWAILTDYDNLAIHVPNLVESKRVGNRRREIGEQGDGQYKCRLFQRGSQKIIGFEFAASVTMDMVESVVVAAKNKLRNRKVIEPQRVTSNNLMFPEEKHINFKCVESQFFTEFDGEWKAVSSPDGASTTLSYVVDVKPKGPVPVAALEWRIREDVPTNLLAVKKAAQECGLEGVLALRGQSRLQRSMSKIEWRERAGAGTRKAKAALAEGKEIVRGMMETKPRRELAPLRVTVDWDENETMAAYMN